MEIFQIEASFYAKILHEPIILLQEPVKIVIFNAFGMFLQGISHASSNQKGFEQ